MDLRELSDDEIFDAVEILKNLRKKLLNDVMKVDFELYYFIKIMVERGLT